MPKQARLSKEQAERIDRARLALKLQKLPSELDAASLEDIADLMVVMKTDDNLYRMRRQRT
jgi:hypothetical protein